MYDMKDSFCYFNLLIYSSHQTLPQASEKTAILEQIKFLDECWSLYTDWKDEFLNHLLLKLN